MNAEIIIKEAESYDLPSIYALVQELADYEKEPLAVTATLQHYQEAFEEGLFSAFVAKKDSETVGMALYYDTFSTWKGKMLYLEDFYVQPQMRSGGVGQQLFDAFLAEAKNRNCKLAKWQVLDWNKKAVKFYERNGATVEKQWWNVKIATTD